MSRPDRLCPDREDSPDETCRFLTLALEVRQARLTSRKLSTGCGQGSDDDAQHHIIKETSETLSRLLQDEFKRNGYKRVHIVEQAPKPDAIEGKLPAVSVYLYQMSIDPEGYDSTPHNELVEVPQEDGTIKEFFRRRRLWVRLDYLMSAWAQTPEDEQLLLGLIIRTVMENPEIPRDRLKGQSFEDDFKLNS